MNLKNMVINEFYDIIGNSSILKHSDNNFNNLITNLLDRQTPMLIHTVTNNYYYALPKMDKSIHMREQRAK